METGKEEVKEDCREGPLENGEQEAPGRHLPSPVFLLWELSHPQCGDRQQPCFPGQVCPSLAMLTAH